MTKQDEDMVFHRLADEVRSLREKLHDRTQELRNMRRDLAEERRADAARALSEALESVWMTMSEGVVVVDTEGELLFVNAAAERLLGSCIEERSLDKIRERFTLYKPDGVTPYTEDELPLTKARKGESTVDAEVLVRDAELGNSFWISLSARPYRDTNGEVAGGFLVYHEISAYKEALYSLKTSEERLRAVFDSMLDAIICIDEDGRIESVNPAAERVFGYGSTEFVGRDAESLICGGRCGIIVTCLQERNGPSGQHPQYGREVMGRRKDGSTFPMEVTVSTMQTGGHRTFVVIVRDVTSRKKAEEELARLSMVASKTDNGVIITNARRITEWVNDGFTRLSGYEPGELVGKKPGAVLQGPLTNRETVGQIRRCLDTKQSFSGEILNYHRSGTPYWNYLSITPILDKNGEVEHFIAIQRDVTEQKRAEAKMREQASFVQNNPAPVMQAGPGGVIKTANPAARRVFPGDLEGSSVYDLLDELSPEKLAANDGGMPLQVEQQADSREYLFTVGQDPVSGCLYIYGSDVSELKRVEAELRKLTRAIEQSPVSVIITDTKGRIEYVNPKFTESTGYTWNEAVGQTPGLLNSGLQGPELYKEMWEAISSGQVWRGEMCNRKKSGELYWEAISISPLRDPSGKIAHYVSVQEDVTEMRHMLQELRVAKDAAESANKAKSQFLANMSHELRTPLNTVIGFSELLEDQVFGGLNEKQARYVSNIHSSGRHLLALINDILDLSKVEAGRTELDMTDFDVAQALKDAESMVTTLAKKKNITLTMAQDGELPVLTADQPKFKQIMYNLFSNAIKFTPENGDVKVVATCNTSDDGERYIAVSVEDNGVGIKPEDQEKIFHEFEQLDSSYARQQPGSGLGLALTQKLVQLHGGHIWVESSGENRGSIFTFLLPVRGPGESAPPRHSGDDSATQQAQSGLSPGKNGGHDG